MDLFRVIYYNPDEPQLSELIGLFGTYDIAVDQMIKAAHYSVGDDGDLRQYRQACDDYETFDELRGQAYATGKLEDYDLYYIIHDNYRHTELIA
jgi:hypothetical protein